MANKDLKASCHPDRVVYSKGLCRNCHTKDWYSRNPGAKVRHHKDTYQRRKANGKVDEYNYQRNYGISAQKYVLMFAEQLGRCAICTDEPKSFKRLAVDHDHKTGKIRGLLCDPCNMGLGFIERKPGLVRLMGEYLAKTSY